MLVQMKQKLAETEAQKVELQEFNLKLSSDYQLLTLDLAEHVRVT